MEEGVSLFGKHLEKVEVKEWLNEKIHEKITLDMQCFMMLKKVQEYLPDELCEKARELCDKRIDIADSIMRVILNDREFRKSVGI